MFALADNNNFYMSCERFFRPSLQARSVIVLSNNDGCVIARSIALTGRELAHRLHGEPSAVLRVHRSTGKTGRPSP